MWKENWLLWKYWSILANIQFVQKFPDIQINKKKNISMAQTKAYSIENQTATNWEKQNTVG